MILCGQKIGLGWRRCSIYVIVGVIAFSPRAIIIKACAVAAEWVLLLSQDLGSAGVISSSSIQQYNFT